MGISPPKATKLIAKLEEAGLFVGKPQLPPEPDDGSQLPARALYPRRTTQYVLGGISFRKIRELEEAGLLTKIRLGKKPTAAVFHLVEQVHALARGEATDAR